MPGGSKSEEQHRRDVCVVGRWMYEQGFNVACEGNLSVRLEAERILNTPTCMNKGRLEPEDLVVTNLDGKQLAGNRRVSSELGLHLLFYRMRPDVNAICHAHPPTATGFAVAGRALDKALLRSEEHTSELQSLAYLVCRLLLEKKKKKKKNI